MPQVHNGIGTWYYGKKNLQEYTGICQLCHYNATLSSYDTRLYFVIFMIPMFPLGQKHIIEKCSICKRHRPLPLADWKIRSQRLEEAIADYRANPRDPQKAREAMGSIGGCRDRMRFLELAPEVEGTFPRDGKMLCDLAAMYDSFGEIGQTERLLKNAMAVEDSDDVREAVADSLIRQAKPEEAEPYLQHIITKQIPDRVNYLYQLAQGFQAKGNHDKALALFAQCEVINPEISQDKTFERLREASAEKIGTNEPVKPAKVIQKIKSSAARRKFFKVAPVVVLVALAIYLGLAFFQGIRSPVYLVNGLNRSYTVRLNGTSYNLPPGDAMKVHVSEGNIKVEIVDAGPSVPAETVSIHSSFWSRPFSSHAFVLNPDQAAIINYYKEFYASNGAPDPVVTLVGGQLLHQFDHIDYPFETPPDSISTDQTSGTVEKQVLAVFNSSRVPPDLLLVRLTQRLGLENVKHIAERHLLLEPERTGYIDALQQLTNWNELADFLKPGLSTRPVRMAWHRAYQSAMMSLGQDEVLEHDYTQMLAADPQNVDLIYLAGRATRDPDKHLALLQQAANANPPSAYAFYSLCGYYLSNAQFPEAAQNAKRAVALLKNDSQVRRYCVSALTAAGDFPAALSIIQPEQQSQMPHSMEAYLEEMYVRLLQNQPAQAADAISQIRGLAHKLTPQFEEEDVSSAEAIQAYVNGNADGFVSRMKTFDDPDQQFSAAITAGDLKTANDVIDKLRRGGYTEALIYLSALQHGDTKSADESFKRMIDLLAKGDYEDRAYAAAIQQKSKLPLPQLLRLQSRPEEKATLLIVLGLHDPSARDQCFALAKKLNFDKRFPYLLLKGILDAPPVH